MNIRIIATALNKDSVVVIFADNCLDRVLIASIGDRQILTLYAIRNFSKFELFNNTISADLLVTLNDLARTLPDLMQLSAALLYIFCMVDLSRHRLLSCLYNKLR